MSGDQVAPYERAAPIYRPLIILATSPVRVTIALKVHVSSFFKKIGPSLVHFSYTLGCDILHPYAPSYSPK
jgi:hypothetical protein